MKLFPFPAPVVARAAFLPIVCVSLAACQRHEAAAPAPRPVVAVEARADGLANTSTLPGQIQSRYSTPLSFRINGKILERRVRLGDSVKAGQVVARLDPADAEKNSASARAQLDAAEHQLVYAKQQLDRDRAQAAENLIAPAQLEQTQNAYAAALAQRNQAQQQAGLAGDQLRYATLTADHAGVITAEQADTGQNVTAGQAVYTLAWSGDTDVICDVPEAALAAFAVGKEASVKLAALPAQTFRARVRERSPAADTQSRTWRAKLTLEAPTPDVRLGMTADVTFSPANVAKGAFTVPSTALFHDNGHPAVWIVKKPGDALELRRVEVARYGERTVTIASGIEAGERIVWQGVHTVTAGEKVRVVAPLHPEDFAS
ncbi:efflux RND transporter periplasmic adaptor subunit [Caballeronia ptereochthonis]|uniref:RND family efflux transporter MFP subunit n=1 Tax=Caballeronia ptereochthonis TaxID=1777144 RepID=A0A158AXA9_9BURK|nr:efflux RND transporter periplasmic adaptor subunit [Caballeronia ptereochthonis]SAK61657.1 RND family efflux transporter MFP subunit [Caballeronia ptereochthonis]